MFQNFDEPCQKPYRSIRGSIYIVKIYPRVAFPNPMEILVECPFLRLVSASSGDNIGVLTVQMRDRKEIPTIVVIITPYILR